MDIRKMFERCLTKSGQFLLGIDNIELDQDKFVDLVKDVIGKVNKHVPPTDQFNVETPSRKYIFTGGEPTKESLNGRTPYKISKVLPVNLSTANPFAFDQNLRQGNSLYPFNGGSNNTFLEQKCNFPVEYRQPNLYLPTTGRFDVLAVYQHYIKEETAPNGEIIKSVPTIEDYEEDADIFFNLLMAGFMIGLGRTRRAFTLGDLPIQTDANELVQDGYQLEEKTIENMVENNQKWWLGW